MQKSIFLAIAFLALVCSATAQHTEKTPLILPLAHNVGKASLWSPVLGESSEKVQATYQHTTNNATGIEQKHENFTSFTADQYKESSEISYYNSGYEKHPELGVLHAGAPCSNCYELLGKRTLTQKYFVIEGSDARDFILQSGSEPLHYKGADGNWYSVSDRLEADKENPGYFRTVGRETIISINTTEGYAKVTSPVGSLIYNHDLELVLISADGSEHSMGAANWKDYTIGDDGMRVRNVWPGIDMEMTVLINRLKTNFVVSHAMPAYAGGRLLIRDHMVPGGVKLDRHDKEAFVGALTFSNNNGEGLFQLQQANAYEYANQAATREDLKYKVNADYIVDIEVPGSWFDRPTAAYPVVIDPLLISGTAATGGFTYYPAVGIVYCTNTNNVVIPAAATLTDIIISYAVSGVVGSSFFEQEVDFAINGACRSTSMWCPGWTPSGLAGSSCGLSSSSFWGTSGYGANWSATSCRPAFNCSSYTLPFQMYNSQMHASTPACAQTVFASSTPFTVSVHGNIPTAPVISPSASVAICAGTTLALSGSPSGGTWSSSGGAATVSTSGLVTGVSSGVSTINYGVTDACGVTYATKTVSVNVAVSVAAIVGPLRVCKDASVTLTNATAGGVWSSSVPAVGTISTSGTLTGITPGTTVVSYTITNACGTYAATRIMTVDAIPASGIISGTTGICTPGSSTLSASVAGGTWTSSTTGIATVGLSSGIVSGIASGTSLITYTTSNTYCTTVTTTVVTVSVMPVVSPITGIGSICQGAARTFTDAAAGGTWSSTATGVATVGSLTGFVKGVAAGTATISYTIANSCATVAATFTVTVDPIFAGTMGNIVTMAGTGVAGHTGDGGPATSAKIYAPYYIATDTAGNIFVADSVGDIRKINTSGIISNFVTGHTASLMATDVAGNVYFMDHGANTVYKATTSGVVTPFLTSLSNVGGMCTDDAGNLYLAFLDGNQVFKYIPPSTTPILFAGTGSISVSGDGGPATSADLGHWVQGLAFDPANNFYISTYFPSGAYERIRKVDATGIINTAACTSGFAGFSGDGGPATAAQISNVFNIWADKLGNVLVTDYGNHRIRKINESTGIISTIAGTSSTVYNGENLVPTTANIDVFGVLTDRSGNIIIADLSNYRIRRIPNVAGTITGTATVCVGATTTLANTFFPAYSSWVSSNPTVATVTSAGVVTGVAGGTATITYRVSNSCNWTYATKVVTVTALPNPGTLSGSATVCETATIAIAASVTGGTYSSGAPGTASVSGTGIVTGIAAGTAIISYTVNNSCGTATATTNITVASMPDAGTITGDDADICVGEFANLSNPVAGGVWGSIGTKISVSSAGVATGVALGNDTATYTVSNTSCSAIAKYAIAVSCESGVNNHLYGKSSVRIFPNPTQGMFSVLITSTVNEEAIVVITNVAGQKVKETTLMTNKEDTIILNQPTGVYFVSVVTSHDKYTAKIVLTR